MATWEWTETHVRPDGRPTTIRPDGTKMCRKCREVLPLNSFYRHSSDLVYHPRCKKCEVADAKYRRHNGDAAFKERQRITAKKSNIKRLYGLTWDAFTYIFESQQGKCKICETELDFTGNKRRRWAVDHCHSTGAVRGILCPRCNTGLGLFKDSPELLVKASKYLTKDD